MKTKFSFIIPTRNEAAYLEECIRSIRNQTRNDYEIIVVDTLSTDGTKEIAKKNARLVNESRKGVGIARNTGAKKAGGDILIFADADVRFAENFLEKLEERFGDNIGGGICSLRCYDGNSYIKKIYSGLNPVAKLLIRIGKPVTTGSCFIYSKKYFHEVGGFDPKFILNEDHELAKRMHRHNKRFVFFQDIKVETSARRVEKMGFMNLALLYLKADAFFVLKKAPPKETYPDWQ